MRGWAEGVGGDRVLFLEFEYLSQVETSQNGFKRMHKRRKESYFVF